MIGVKAASHAASPPVVFLAVHIPTTKVGSPIEPDLQPHPRCPMLAIAGLLLLFVVIYFAELPYLPAGLPFLESQPSLLWQRRFLLMQTAGAGPWVMTLPLKQNGP